MADLTVTEIDTLMEALDAWESKDMGDTLMTGMLSMALLSKEDAKAEMEKEMAEAREKTRRKKETSILLKAKLIGMKDGATVSEACNMLRVGI